MVHDGSIHVGHHDTTYHKNTDFQYITNFSRFQKCFWSIPKQFHTHNNDFNSLATLDEVLNMYVSIFNENTNPNTAKNNLENNPYTANMNLKGRKVYTNRNESAHCKIK